MRIVTFVNSDKIDEVSTEALGFAMLADEAGHEVLLVGLVWEAFTPKITPLGKVADERGIPFRILQKRFLADPGYIGQARAMFLRTKPDLFQSYGLSGALIGPIARKSNAVWQAIERGADYETGAGMMRGMLNRTSRRWLKKANQIVADKEIEFLAASKHLKEKIVIVPSQPEGERKKRILECAERIVQTARIES